MSKRLDSLLAAAVVWMLPAIARAESDGGSRSVVSNGVGGVWVLCNVSYAGMRAQNHPSGGWRAAAFIFGLPGTLVSYFAVKEGEGRAYGIRLPPG